MSYVQPTGRIELFRGVNLDNRYMHTLYFADTAAQTDFFNNYSNKVAFTKQSYSRAGRGYLKIQANAENINTVTYMRFQNYYPPDGPSGQTYPHSESKWYYAFVNYAEYVNENTTLISYEIDVMQTWFFQTGHQINPCMVEREHVPISDDKLKRHLEPEPVSSDVYRYDEITPSNAGSFDGYNVVINTTNAVDDTSKLKKDGIICGTEYWTTSDQYVGMIQQHLNDTLGSWDKNEQTAEVTDFYMYPSELINENEISLQVKIDGSNNEQLDGLNYDPDNMKMWSYPYSFLYVTNKGGACATYRWEYFDDDQTLASSHANFKIIGNATGGGSYIIYPRDYNGITDDIDDNLTFSNFPKCSWSFDAYQAFVASGGQTKLNAQQKFLNYRQLTATARDVADIGNAAVSVAKDTIKGGAAAAVGAVGLTAMSAASAASTIASTAASIGDRHIELQEAQNKIDFAFADAKYAPDITVGAQIPNIAVGEDFLGAYFFNCHIDPMEMVRIDNFFTVYGYAINTVKEPIMTGRPYWNFLKTNGAVVKGDMPASSKEAIARILDGGIFFWNRTRGNDNIGNFMQSSTVVDFGTQIHNR